MADVTDVAFRRVILKYGKPDVFWTEFVSADGLILAPHEPKDNHGLSPNDKLQKDLDFEEGEHPIVAQLFGSNPETMEKAARIAADRGFDGIDINMGCPDRSIEKQGAGASMIKNPDTAKEIIRATKRGAPNLPISVKTRLGYNKDELDRWLPELLEEDVAVITIHLRTRKEMSKVPAHWERMKDAVKMRDDSGKETLIIGNGDITTIEEAKKIAKETGCDGVMIGRGIFGNPWCFNPEIDRDTDVSIEERLQVMIEHTKAFEELLSYKNFAIMKKHYKAYVDGFSGAKELRMELMEAKDSVEVSEIVTAFLAKKANK